MSLTRLRELRSWFSIAAIASAVLAGLGNVPLAGAAGRKVVGVVLASTGARSASAPLIDGDTLTSGDLVQTGSGGSARLRLGRGTQVSLGAQTAVRFKSDSGRVVVAMSSGATMIRRTGTDAVTVETPGFRVEPAEQGRAVYIVAMLPGKTDVAARTGKLVITDVGSAEQTFVSEGEVAEISGSPQDQESGKAAPGKASGQASTTASEKGQGHAGTIVLAGSTAATAAAVVSHTTIIILAGAGAAAAGVGLAAAAGSSATQSGPPPSSPAKR